MSCDCPLIRPLFWLQRNSSLECLSTHIHSGRSGSVGWRPASTFSQNPARSDETDTKLNNGLRPQQKLLGSAAGSRSPDWLRGHHTSRSWQEQPRLLMAHLFLCFDLCEYVWLNAVRIASSSVQPGGTVVIATAVYICDQHCFAKRSSALSFTLPCMFRGGECAWERCRDAELNRNRARTWITRSRVGLSPRRHIVLPPQIVVEESGITRDLRQRQDLLGEQQTFAHDTVSPNDRD